ncbi:hypothetical protein YC2023_061282 [Brassica napus]
MLAAEVPPSSFLVWSVARVLFFGSGIVFSICVVFTSASPTETSCYTCFSLFSSLVGVF